MLGSFNPWKHYDNYSEQMFEDKSSDLQQWPIKLWQVPELSPYFHHAHLLIAADCSAFACPTFHDIDANTVLGHHGVGIFWNVTEWTME